MAAAETVAWVRPPEPIRGLDHLGVQAPCIALYGQLLPVITNVTDRARYYSFHRELRYRTQDSWTRGRRVVAKAEWLGDKSNPRFVVTSFCEEAHPAQALYEKLYCARGDMENRIKEQQLDLFADRTSAHTMRANQLRLWFASVA